MIMNGGDLNFVPMTTHQPLTYRAIDCSATTESFLLSLFPAKSSARMSAAKSGTQEKAGTKRKVVNGIDYHPARLIYLEVKLRDLRQPVTLRHGLSWFYRYTGLITLLFLVLLSFFPGHLLEHSQALC